MARKILLATLLAVGWGCDSGADEATRQAPESDRAASIDERPVVLFLGTSLTAGYGLELVQAYPALIQAKIDSAGYRFRVVNAGESGGTSAGGIRRVSWLLRQRVAVLVLELGANDGLRGHDPAATKANLEQIIDSTEAAHPDARIVIAGMEAPPNMGDEYTTAFRQLFVDVARERRAGLIPFLLEGVGGIPELNQADGIHPTAEAQGIIAENVWLVLHPLLAQLSDPEPEAGPSG
jgi:acyl-CoA thioesterase-1